MKFLWRNLVWTSCVWRHESKAARCLLIKSYITAHYERVISFQFKTQMWQWCAQHICLTGHKRFSHLWRANVKICRGVSRTATIRHDRYFRMGRRILQDGEDPARWGGSCKMGRILQDGEDPTQKRRQKVFLHSLFSIVCCIGGKAGRRRQKIFKGYFQRRQREDVFFQRGGQSGMNSLLAPGLQPFSPHFSTQKSGKPEIFSVNCEEKGFRSLKLI